MTIFIVGLGLIGASYADKLSLKGYTVYGYDLDTQILDTAIKARIIAPDSNLEKIQDADLIITALYPKATIAFLKAHFHLFNESQTITDVCGIKEALLQEIDTFYPESLRYLTHHPMAGKETPGIAFKDPNMFQGANVIVCESHHTKPGDQKRMRTLIEALGFGNVAYLTPREHDQFVAYTSQLTHALAAALINSNPTKATRVATGDSFKDLTRIANINAPLWVELFKGNKKALLNTINGFEDALSTIKNAIENDDDAALEKTLLEAKKGRVSYE